MSSRNGILTLECCGAPLLCERLIMFFCEVLSETPTVSTSRVFVQNLGHQIP